MISGLFGLAFIILFVGGLALGVAFLLDVTAPRTGFVKRAVVAALVAGFLPMIVPFLAFVAGGEGPTAVAAAPLVIAGLILALLIGFPVAYFFSRRRTEARGAMVDPETFK